MVLVELKFWFWFYEMWFWFCNGKIFIWLNVWLNGWTYTEWVNSLMQLFSKISLIRTRSERYFAFSGYFGNEQKVTEALQIISSLLSSFLPFTFHCVLKSYCMWFLLFSSLCRFLYLWNECFIPINLICNSYVYQKSMKINN
jgi:hypothetical protein